MIFEPTVFVVDDDEGMSGWLRELISSVGLHVETSGSAREFLADYDPAQPGCRVLDIRMPGMSGLDLQTELAARASHVPIIIITGYGDIPAAVRAMKAQAVDFLQKPFNGQQLLDLIHEAIERDAQNRREQARRDDIDARLKLLTPRERQALELLVAGKANKQIAFHLSISVKTVESHRAKVMKKLAARSVVDLVRMTLLDGARGNP